PRAGGVQRRRDQEHDPVPPGGDAPPRLPSRPSLDVVRGARLRRRTRARDQLPRTRTRRGGGRRPPSTGRGTGANAGGDRTVALGHGRPTRSRDDRPVTGRSRLAVRVDGTTFLVEIDDLPAGGVAVRVDGQTPPAGSRPPPPPPRA